MKPIFMEAIHVLKLQLEKFKNYFDENRETLSNEKFLNKCLKKELKFYIFLLKHQTPFIKMN